MTRRLSFAIATLVALVLSSPRPAAAASPVTGTIACSVFSDPNHGPKGIVYRPFINATPRGLHIAATNTGSSCDNSNVAGGKAPITGVQFKFTARLPDGTCSALTSAAPPFENTRITVKWRGLNTANHFTTVAKSRARVTSVAYDTGTHAFELTTEPLTGAFAGKTLSLHLGIEQIADDLEAGCAPVNGYIATPFGNTNPSTLEVQ